MQAFVRIRNTLRSLRASCSVTVGCCEPGVEGLVLIEHCSICCVLQGIVGMQEKEVLMSPCLPALGMWQRLTPATKQDSGVDEHRKGDPSHAISVDSFRGHWWMSSS